MIRATLLKPLVNEKSMELIKSNMYTFVVDKKSTKEQIARIVKSKFNVDVLEVKTINIKGKQKMQPSRTRRDYFKTSDVKKAIVKVKNGQKIAIFEISTPEEEVEVRTAEGETVTKAKEKKSLLRDTKVKIEREGGEK